MKWLSKNVEELIANELVETADDATQVESPKMHDAVVVGSGYGGAVSALRLAKAGVKVLLLERGEEWLSGEFPNDLGNAFSAVRIERVREASPKETTPAVAMGYESALFDLRMGTGIAALVGNGLGGTSLINANVVIEPDRRVFDKWTAPIPGEAIRHAWPANLSNLRNPQGKTEWDKAFKLAKAELGAELFSTVDLWTAPNLKGVQSGTVAEPQKLTRLKELKEAITQPNEDRSTITFEPAWLTVRLGQTVNIEVPPRLLSTCIGCGDCVSGCNQNAKKSLDTTYLAKAHTAGASMFTGVSALKIEHATDSTDDKPHWIIHFVQTQARGKLRNTIPIPRFQLHARHVILSAGTFGSTEILLRSKSDSLQFSERLGHRLSTNGDAIAFGYGLTKPVHGIGSGAKYFGGTYTGVGPTITGNIHIDHPDHVEKSVLIQDAAIPGAIASLFHEGITSLATFAQLDEWKFRGASLQPDTPRGTTDWAVLQAAGLAHTQTLLAMGHDKSAGTITFDPERDGLVVVYPRAGGQTVYERQEKFLQQMTAQGAVYIQNPIVSPLPPKVSKILSGSVPGNATLTVHPLGGCCMADEVAHGVVNEHGRVFRPRTSGFWEGLYVLDGSIIPTSLGANPMLTITAVAERAMKVLAPQIAATKVNCATPQSAPREPVGGWPQEAPYLSNAADVKLNFTEAMRGEIMWLQELRQAHLLLQLPVSDLSHFWADGEHRIIIPNQLERDPDDKEKNPPRLRLDKENPSREVTATQTLWVMSGEISILPVPTLHLLARLSLGLRTVLTWFLDRGFHELVRILITDKIAAFQSRLQTGHFFADKSKTDEPEVDWGAYITSFLKFAKHASESRVMQYRLTLRDDNTQLLTDETEETTPPFATYHLLGTKQIGYAASGGAIFWKMRLPSSYMERTNVWQSLGQMQVQIDDDCCNPVAQGTLNLDLLDMSRMHAPQLSMQRDTPNALLALVGYPLWFMRLLVKTRIWDFRLPDFPDKLPIEFDREQEPIPDAKSDTETPWPDFPPLRIYLNPSAELTLIAAEKSEELKVQRYADDPSDDDRLKIPLRLTRYKQPKIKTQTLNGSPTQAKVLLMLNGFAQSTLGFVPQEHKRWPSVNGKTSTGEIDEPGLAEFFYEQGFDIWLFDYRTSSILDASKLPCSMDDIAQFDIPGAVDHILGVVRGELNLAENTQLQIYAFAHCVGAASLAMSMLGGHLAYNPKEDKPVSKLAGITLSQMQAYLVGSTTAQLRLQAGGILRDTLGIDYLRLSAAERQPTPMESLLDRLFASLPVDEGEHCPQENARYWPRPGICTCKRMTGSISRLLKHDMIKEETHDRLPIYFGRANTSLLVHGGRCVENERLVNADGQNIYVTDANIKKYMRLPIAILHGHHNALFNVESAHRTFQQFGRVNLDLISKPSPAEQAYDLIIAKDYAHFDCTIGFGARMQDQILQPLKGFYEKAWKLGGHLPEPSTQTMPRPGEVCSEGKAPLAGPIMGWSRSITPSNRLIRFWIEVDESESDLAKFAVTVVRRRVNGQSDGFESAQLWSVVRVPLEFVAGRDAKDLGNWPAVAATPLDLKRPRVAIALADLEFSVAADASDYFVQMFSVHEFWFNTAASGNNNTVLRPPGLIARPITPKELEAANQPGKLPGRGTLPFGLPGGLKASVVAIAGSTPLSGTLPRSAGSSEVFERVLRENSHHFKLQVIKSPDSYVEQIMAVGLLPKADAQVLLDTLHLREAMPVEEAQRGKPVTLSRDKRHLRPNQSMPYTARVPAALLSPKSVTHGLRFLATCCRHPGLGFEDVRADASFARMEQLLQSDPQRHHDCLLLLGDQIYADASYGLIDNPSPIEKITIRNRKAFSARGFNSISTQVPTYMVFDDHEIVDLWCVEDRAARKLKLRRPAKELYGVAIASFAAYQWSHGPRNSSTPGFNYHFVQRGFSFFTLDTRTQRHRFTTPPTVCTTAQLNELKQWLANFNQSDTAPKFIMTGSLVVPGLINENLPGHIANPMAESWQMAPVQRAELLRTIAEKKVRNVVFLSGDIHCDATAELRFDNDLKAYAIVTPPLYAPLPGANSKISDVLKQEVIELGGGSAVSVKAQARDGNGFADIHVTPLPGNQWRLSVHFYRLQLEEKEPQFRMEIREFLLS